MYIHNPSTLETEAGKVSEATLVYLDSSRPTRACNKTLPQTDGMEAFRYVHHSAALASLSVAFTI